MSHFSLCLVYDSVQDSKLYLPMQVEVVIRSTYVYGFELYFSLVGGFGKYAKISGHIYDLEPSASLWAVYSSFPLSTFSDPCSLMQ